MTLLLSAPPLRGMGEGVVEGIKGAGARGRDRELKAVSEPRVLDRDGERLRVWVPEQQDVDAVALAGGELASLRRCRAHDSSVPFGRAHAPTLGGARRCAIVRRSGSSSDSPPIPA